MGRVAHFSRRRTRRHGPDPKRDRREIIMARQRRANPVARTNGTCATGSAWGRGCDLL